jgi:peroxiredoxin
VTGKHWTDQEEAVMALLGPGDLFPTLTINQVDGHKLTLPDALADSFGVVLFYRGSWCPYCIAQLRAFQRASERFAESGVKVVALSVDDESETAKMIAKNGITFPVGHSVDATQVSSATGAFVNPQPVYLQSTGFVLDPSGKVVVSVFSSGAIGRLVPDDVLGLVRYANQTPSSN